MNDSLMITTIAANTAAVETFGGWLWTIAGFASALWVAHHIINATFKG